MARVALTIRVRLRRLQGPETLSAGWLWGAWRSGFGGSTLRRLVPSAGKTLARVRRNCGPCGPTGFKIFRFPGTRHQRRRERELYALGFKIFKVSRHLAAAKHRAA